MSTAGWEALTPELAEAILQKLSPEERWVSTSLHNRAWLAPVATLLSVRRAPASASHPPRSPELLAASATNFSTTLVLCRAPLGAVCRGWDKFVRLRQQCLHLRIPPNALWRQSPESIRELLAAVARRPQVASLYFYPRQQQGDDGILPLLLRELPHLRELSVDSRSNASAEQAQVRKHHHLAA